MTEAHARWQKPKTTDTDQCAMVKTPGLKNRISPLSAKSQKLSKCSIRIQLLHQLYSQCLDILNTENYVSNFADMSSSRVRSLTCKQIFRFPDFFQLREVFFRRQSNHFQIINTLLMTCLERKHLKILKCKSQCLKRQQPGRQNTHNEVNKNNNTNTTFYLYGTFHLRTSKDILQTN